MLHLTGRKQGCLQGCPGSSSFSTSLKQLFPHFTPMAAQSGPCWIILFFKHRLNSVGTCPGPAGTEPAGDTQSRLSPTIGPANLRKNYKHREVDGLVRGVQRLNSVPSISRFSKNPCQIHFLVQLKTLVFMRQCLEP